jgi:hypothetical protein
MTKDDIIQMAREAGFYMENSAVIRAAIDFAALVAAHKAEVITAESYRCGYEAGVVAEREACAKVCETHAAANTSWTKAAVKDCADAIRSRTTP